MLLDPDLIAEHELWTEELKHEQEQARRAETIHRAYDGAITRTVRVEAKAVGLLQVIAIGFATVAIVLAQHSGILRLLSIISIVYLILATLGALEILRVRPHQQVVVAHARSATGGLVETAVAAHSLEQGGPWAANLVSGALRDLQVGFGAALVALVLMVVGYGDRDSTPVGSEPPMHTTTTTAPATTTTVTPTTIVTTTSTVAPTP